MKGSANVMPQSLRDGLIFSVVFFTSSGEFAFIFSLLELNISFVLNYFPHCNWIKSPIISNSILLEIGIILSHVIWLFRTRKVRSEAKAANLPMDEYIQKNFARDRMRRKKKNTDIEMINATVTRPARTLEKRTNPPTSSIPAQYDFGKHNSIHVVTRTEPTLSKE